ncbi:MAG: TIGR04283 family arsenosugar biosynthesis glycosyltransferase [Rhodobacteraceae bacterium]|nr:TIGR04283 family arsenosugar biosynthesis glycosyltransferase [Paracoccaceae bacterium]
MRAPISVIVPTLNDASELPASLTALIEGVEAGLIGELIISDGGSKDHTRAIADDAGAIWVEGRPSRGAQFQRGAEVSRGDWLLFLHPDTRLEAGWSGPISRALEETGAFHFRLTFRASGVLPSWVAGWANLRSVVFKLPYGDQGLLVHRRDFTAVGGYPDVPVLEDLVIARALRDKLREVPIRASSSAHVYTREGWILTGLRRVFLRLRYRLGAKPERLVKAYSGSDPSAN